MSEIEPAGVAAGSTKTKEPSPSSIQCPMLSSTNYSVWAMRMKVMLKVYKVWETIDPGSEESDKNDLATALLFQAIPETLILQVGDQAKAKDIWDSIKSRHLGAERVKEARLQTLMTEFDKLQMRDNDTIDSFSNKLSEIASKATFLGESIEESKMVKKFLKSLPRMKYIQITASLEQVLDLNQTSFEEIVGRLKAYEERINDDVANGENQSRLMFTNVESHKFYDSRSRGRGTRGCGGRGNRGRGRGMFAPREQVQTNQDRPKERKDRSKLICYRCDKPGHYASKCPERVQKLQEANLAETKEADAALYMHEVVFLNEENLVPTKYETKEEVWYLDNGASNHMTGEKSYFSELNEQIVGKVKFGDGSCIDIGGKGSIIFEGKTGEQRLLSDIYYIPELKSNILSLGQATEHGCDVRMKANFLTLHDPTGRLLIRATRSENRLYKISLKIGKPICFYSKIESDSWRWHARLGHIGYHALKALSTKGMVYGLPKIEHEKEVCESCLVGKQTRHSFPQATTYRASRPLELLHGDLCGPISPATAAHNRYIFVIIDDYSRYMWSILLKEKGEAFERFKRYKALIERDMGVTVKTLRTDRGGEFTSREFQDYCEENGISRHLTAPYTPQQNGVVERRNRTLMEMTRSILKAMNVPNYLWGEAVRHSTYIINRVPTRALKDQTPYEVLRNKKPSIDHLRVFGCLAYAKADAGSLKKLDDRSVALVHLGIEPGSKAYRLYNPSTRRVVVSRDVVFDEQNGWKWKKANSEERSPGMFEMIRGGIFDAGSGPFVANSHLRSPETANTHDGGGDFDHEDGSFDHAHEGEDDHTDSTDVQNESNSDIGEQNQHPLRRSSRQTRQPKYLGDYVLLADIEGEKLLLNINDEPSCYEEAKNSAEWTNDQVEMEHVPGIEQKADILTKSLAKFKFREMRDMIGVKDLSKSHLEIKGVNVG